ncbi:hypothetical protein [Desulfonatronum lacustre]|uniref:hypothetical protein n=1 Tax=Desulfonatronum lacustre TaxID=66849 RepID=UPI00048CEA74|nr:hypothetical protein [Desulfonatronum lacustre]
MSDKTIMETIKARLGSAKEAELKELYADVRNQAGEDMAKIDAYIDARIASMGEQLRREYKESMELQRAEMKAMNQHLLVSAVLTWMFIVGYFIIRFVL